MSLAQDTRGLPELANAPPAFRHVARLIARSWTSGELTFVLPSGRDIHVKGEARGPSARLVIKDLRAMRRVVTGGVIGFAEGYIAGDWDTPDLPALLETLSSNLDAIQDMMRSNPVIRTIDWMTSLRHRLRPNTRKGSRKNIHAHYDLGNAFYSGWLDPTMTYSSALFDQPGMSLAQAQTRKYEALAQSMDLQAGHHVLEIGCGWGGFAEYAAKEVGARVTAITISQEQYDFARRRMFDQGLSERADIRMVDYRDVEGRFDRVASIEMFEAVGERYWPTYFDKIRDVLAPRGRAGLQIITIREALFEDYRDSADFIQKYIFPGGMLPSEERLKVQTDRAGLAWSGMRRFGQDYADTLLQWLASFDAAWADIRPQGFDARFRRLWRFYLAYCEAGFRTERTDVIQLGLIKT